MQAIVFTLLVYKYRTFTMRDKKKKKELKRRRIENGTTIISTIVVIAVYCVEQSILSLCILFQCTCFCNICLFVCVVQCTLGLPLPHISSHCIYPSINLSIHQLLCPHISTIVDGRMVEWSMNVTVHFHLYYDYRLTYSASVFHLTFCFCVSVCCRRIFY